MRELSEAASAAVSGVTGRALPGMGSAARAGLPPRRLRARTGAPGVDEFTHGGARAAGELQAALEAPFSAYGAILDFGCGSARVLPHVAALAPGAVTAGCDVDATAIAWAQAHHPRLRFSVSDYEPPLPYAAASFTLVYSISVFSHLDERLQDAWLAELRRVLAPGGVALLSIHGRHAFEQFRAGRVRTSWCRPRAFDRAALRPDEFAFEPYVRSIFNRGELPRIESGYGLAFHGEAYVHSHWSQAFDIDRIVPRALTDWQDLVVCRGREQRRR